MNEENRLTKIESIKKRTASIAAMQNIMNRTAKSGSDMTVDLESIYYDPIITIPTKFVHPIFQLNRAVNRLGGSVAVALNGQRIQFILHQCDGDAKMNRACMKIVKVMNKLTKDSSDGDESG